jgi:DNA-binding NarL/FixJ family response regulator
VGNTPIGVVDGHPIFLDALKDIFSKNDTFRVVATGSSAADAVRIALQYDIEILVIDAGAPGDTFAAISKINTERPNTKIVVFTAATGIDCAVRSLEAGANGYILKGSTADELVSAVYAVMSGETFITQQFAAKVITALRDASLRKRAAQAINLSLREEQIVRLLLRGRTNKEIASHLTISEKTVKHYMTALMQKLNARNRTEVVLAAQKLSPETHGALWQSEVEISRPRARLEAVGHG